MPAGVVIEDERAVLRCNHLQGQLVVAAQEGHPGGGSRNIRGYRRGEYIPDRRAVARGQGLENLGHQGEVVGGVAFILRAEILHHIPRTLVRLGQEQRPRFHGFEGVPEDFKECVGFAQVFTGSPFLLPEVGNGVGPESVYTPVEPRKEYRYHLEEDPGVPVVQVGLDGKEPVKIVLAGSFVILPVARAEPLEDNPGIGVLLRRIGPDEKIPVLGIPGSPGIEEPGVFAAAVIEGYVEDNPDIPTAGFGEKVVELGVGVVG